MASVGADGLGGPVLIADLRRPVDTEAFRRVLRGRPREDVVALTPLAAWLLEREGVAFKPSDSLVPADWFRAEGVRNHARLEEAFDEAFGAQRDSWLGLSYEFRLLIDYALGEERRWEAAEAADAWVVADVPLDSRAAADPWDHIYNRASLYLWGASRERFTRIPASRASWDRLKRAARRVLSADLRARLPRLPLRPGKPRVVTRFDYDWAGFKPAVEARFAALSPERLVRECLSGGAATSVPSDARLLEGLLDALRKRFTGLLPRTLELLLAILDGRARSYAALRRRLRDRLPETARRLGVRGALSTICATHEDFLVNYYLKESGIPTLFYQHGGYMSRPGFVHHGEVVPATHNFVFGSADAEFLRGFRPTQDVHVVGSQERGRLTPPRPRQGRFLYVLLPNPGNALNTEGPLSYPLTDSAALFRRHRRVIELFARHPEAELVIREHPAQAHGVFHHEPLAEFVAAVGARNVKLRGGPEPADRYLTGYEGILLDYVSTTVLYALAKGSTLVCHVGPPYRLDPDGEARLRRAAGCADSDDGFLALIGRWLDGSPPAVEESGRRAFLDRYGGPEGGDRPGAWPLVARLLS